MSTETPTTNSEQMPNTIVYNYEFIEDYSSDSDADTDGANDAQPNAQLSGNSFPMTTLSSYAQTSNKISSDDVKWLIDPKDEGSFSTTTEQGTDKQKWRPKTFSFSCHPLTLMVRKVH